MPSTRRMGLDFDPRSAAVSRAARDQPQHVRMSSRVELFPCTIRCQAAAAGLRDTVALRMFQDLRRSRVCGSMFVVSQTPKSSRPGPPHNPGVRELVEGKRRWSSPPKSEDAKRGFRGWNERGYLPHRDEPGLTQFVTFRLADSFPEALRSEWEHLLKIEDDQLRRAELESYLDKGRGECHLRRLEIAKFVEDAVRFFRGHATICGLGW